MMIRATIGHATYTCRGELETYFQPFRDGTIGRFHPFSTPFGEQRLLYADWTASGRLYRPIEEKMARELGPFVGNTHTESNVTGTKMTLAYRYAKELIKQHVHAKKKRCFDHARGGDNRGCQQAAAPAWLARAGAVETALGAGG